MLTKSCAVVTVKLMSLLCNVPHARIAERARALGAPNVVLTGAADAGEPMTYTSDVSTRRD
jgi:hypothetical protein